MDKTYEEPSAHWDSWEYDSIPLLVFQSPALHLSSDHFNPKRPSNLFCRIKTIKFKIGISYICSWQTNICFLLWPNVFHCKPAFPVSAVLSSSERLVPVSTRSYRSQLVCQLPVWRSGPVVNTPGYAETVITHRGCIQHLLWVLHINSIPPPFSDIRLVCRKQSRAEQDVCAVSGLSLQKVISFWSLLHNQTGDSWQQLPG